MPPRRAVIGRDTHQPVHPRFRLQPAIGIMPGDLVGGRADPGLVARGFGNEFNLIALLLGPTHIHPRQHRGPVAAFGAARPGIDFKEGVVAIRLAVQQRLKLFLGGFLGQGFQVRLGLGDQFGVALGLGQFDHLGIGLQIARQPAVTLDRIRQRLAVAHQLLRPGRVVPQIAILDHGVQLLKPMRGGLPVHALRQEPQGFADRFDGGDGFGAHGLSFQIGWRLK